ncbi:MAG TPA: hypothetical protein VGI19_03605 [Candidatus Cybelea sp.]
MVSRKGALELAASFGFVLLAGCSVLPLSLSKGQDDMELPPPAVPAFGQSPIGDGHAVKGNWKEFSIDGYPQGIVRRRGGDFWIADGEMTDTLTRVSPKGQTATYAIGNEPLELAVDSADNLWATTGVFLNQIIRVTPKMKVTAFSLNDATAGGITVGADGNIWFVENSHVGKLTPDGTLREYSTGQNSGESGLTWAPDGLVWFREVNALASVNSKTGKVTTYGAPMFDCGGAIVAAPDGSIWYTLQASMVTLVHFVPKTGVSTEYYAPPNYRPYGSPAGMILARDGSLWYTVQRLRGHPIKHVIGGGLVRFDPLTKAFTRYPAPNGYNWDWDLIAGPHGTLWTTSGGSAAELKP